MLQQPLDILQQYPVRKTKLQKQAFRNDIVEYCRAMGYPAAVEEGRFGSHNVVIGDPEGASYLVTAHYDTCARLLFPNFIMPCNAPVFLLCQAGKWLSIALAAVILSTLAGLLLGKWIVAPAAVVTVFTMIAVSLLGPANSSNVNDNTSGVVTLLEMARSFPENQRSKVCFVLFDLEEAGLIGSASYRARHRSATDRQLVLNLDCVGDGDHLMMFPSKALRKNRRKLTSLYKACGYFGTRQLLVREKGFAVYPSDQMHFPYGVGICALRKNRLGLYLSRIHTPRDTILEETNVNILRAALTSFICCDAINVRKEEMK